MKRIDRKRLEALLKVEEVAAVLTQDLEIASKQLAKAYRLRKPHHPINWDVAFSGKTALRTLFGHVGGLASAMRAIAVDLALELGAQIPELQEQRDPQDLVASLKSIFRYFPALFDVELDLDFSSEHGKAFISLVEIRNEMTHPKTLEHLSVRGVHSFWAPGFLWYLSQIGELFSFCARQIPDAPHADQKYELPDYTHAERAEMSSADNGADTGPDFLHTQEHAREAFEVLKEDTGRAMDLSTKLGAEDLLQGVQGQFGIRNLVRTFFAEVEGIIAIESLVISAEDLAASNDLDQKLVEVMNNWSREFGGPGQQAETGGKRWTKFRQALKCRDRLAHPKLAKDLRVSLDEMGAILRAQDWLRDILKPVEVDSNSGAGLDSAQKEEP